MEIKEVFEPVLNFIKNLQQKKDKEPASKQAAKDRLKLVLMQDRASVSPDFFEMMKKEIIDVIKKYIEIDEEALEVELTRGLEAGLEGPALYANIPIKNVKPVAPKTDNEEIDELLTEATPSGLSEEDAEMVADNILSNIESIAVADADNDDLKVSESILSSDKKEDDNVNVDESEKKDDSKVDSKKSDENDSDKNETVKKKTTTRKKSTTATKTKKKE